MPKETTNTGVGKTGYWIKKAGFGGYATTFECSVCGAEISPGGWFNCRTVLQEAPECRVCGAKMGEVESE